jgi:hypothetical protein
MPFDPTAAGGTPPFVPQGGSGLSNVLQMLLGQSGGLPGVAPGISGMNSQGGNNNPFLKGPGILPLIPQVGVPGQQPALAGAPPGAGTLPGTLAGGPSPNLTAAGVTGPSQMQYVPGQQTEWNTSGGRAMALTQNALQSVTQTVNQYRQKQFNQKAAVTEQAFQDQAYYMQQMQDALQKGNGAGVLYWQKKLQDLQNDPKIGKALEKAHSDPSSPEGVGMARAYQTGLAQAEQQLKRDQLAAEVYKYQQEALKAQAETQTAQEQTRTARIRAEADQLIAQARIQAINAGLPFRQEQAEAAASRAATYKVQVDDRHEEVMQRNQYYQQQMQARTDMLARAKGNDAIIKGFQDQTTADRARLEAATKVNDDAYKALQAVGMWDRFWNTNKAKQAQTAYDNANKNLLDSQRQLNNTENSLRDAQRQGLIISQSVPTVPQPPAQVPMVTPPSAEPAPADVVVPTGHDLSE